jgi:hypothetical protein
MRGHPIDSIWAAQAPLSAKSPKFLVSFCRLTVPSSPHFLHDPRATSFMLSYDGALFGNRETGMIKTIVVAGALALGLVVVSPVGPARADGVYLGSGFGGGYHPGPHFWLARRGISCRDGAQIVYSAGFKNVRAQDCNGSEYTYLGRRHDRWYKVTVSSRSGNIKAAYRVGKGGWGGGYGDDDDDYGGYGGGYGDDYDDGDY